MDGWMDGGAVRADGKLGICGNLIRFDRYGRVGIWQEEG